MIQRNDINRPSEAACEQCEVNRTSGACFCSGCGTDLRPAAPAPSVSTLVEEPQVVVADVSTQVQALRPRPMVPAPTDVTSAPPLPPPQEPSVEPLEAEPIDAETPRCCPACGAAQAEENSKAKYYITQVGKDAAELPMALDVEYVVGTDEECDVTITGDSYLSRRHARLRNDGGMIFVDDLGSSNGTLLRIRRPIVIEPGDEILVGTSVLRLEQHG